MSRKGKRTPLAKGIYEDGTGRSVIFRGKEVRFPPHTPMEDLRTARAKLVKKMKGSGSLLAMRGTLAAAVDSWESQEQHLASWKERRAELRAWVHRYGHVRLSALKAEDVRRTVSAWALAGVAPKTVRNRLWSLKHLYQVTLDNPDAETPCDHVEPPAKVRAVINPTPVETILDVYRTLLRFEQDGRLHDAKTRARFMVRASTGRRPCEIMRARQEDVDRERRIWRVRDAKGGWSEGIFLSDDMVIAWTVFVDARAWGHFNTGSHAEVLRAAGWPSERADNGRFYSRPYNMRHSVGIALGEMGHDLADIGGWLGQTNISTTRSHYVPILESRMQRLGKSLDGRLDGWQAPEQPPAPPTPAKVLKMRRA